MTDQPTVARLRECPHCGASRAGDRHDLSGVWVEENDHDDPEYHVRCWACGAQTRQYAEPEAAIAAWNTRALTPLDAGEAVTNDQRNAFARHVEGDSDNPPRVARAEAIYRGEHDDEVAAHFRADAGEAREMVARIIDPIAWERFAEICLNLEYENAAGRNLQRAAATRLIAPSLAKAGAILSALSPAAEGGWLPIESAPKDGRGIVLYSAHHPEFEPWEDRWQEDILEGGCWLFCDLWAEPISPTHWHLLPAPPAREDGGGK